MFAARNIRLCTKDCVCLFVCPTGATDTENGQIDAEKCIEGCRLCVDACPSHAIYLVPERYQQRELPESDVAEALSKLLANKSSSFMTSRIAAENAKKKEDRRLFEALAHSNKILAEDCIRECGYMYPESTKFESMIQSGLLDGLDKLYDPILEALAQDRDTND